MNTVKAIMKRILKRKDDDHSKLGNAAKLWAIPGKDGDKDDDRK